MIKVRFWIILSYYISDLQNSRIQTLQNEFDDEVQILKREYDTERFANLLFLSQNLIYLNKQELKKLRFWVRCVLNFAPYLFNFVFNF